MRRRLRVTVIALVVGLGIPLLIAVGVVAFVATGGLERRIEGEFAARFPGQLRIGHLELAGLGKAIAQDLRLYSAAGGDPVATVREAIISGDLLAGAVDAISLEGVRLRVDSDGIAWLRAVAAAPPSGQTTTSLRISAQGELALAQRLLLRDLTCTLTIAPPGITGEIRGILGDQPAVITLAAQTVADPGTVVTCGALSVPVADALGALAGLGVLDPQPYLLPWLPAQADLAGTTLHIGTGSGDMTGSLHAAWPMGSIQAPLRADAAGIRLDPVQVHDEGLGTATGTMAIAYADRHLRLTLSAWHPGPRLGIPVAVPVDELIELLPNAGLDVIGGDQPRVEARFHNAANTAWITGVWRPNAPIQVDGGGLPLRLAQRYLPAAWTIHAGAISGLSLSWDGFLRRGMLEVANLECGIGAWRMHDLAGTVTVDPIRADTPDDGWEVRLDLPFGAMVHRGLLPGGELELTIADMAGLAERLTGPVPIPRCAGFLKLVATLEATDAGTWQGRLKNLGVAGFTIEGLVRDVALAATGTYAWTDSAVDAKIDGQLHTAEVGLPGRWLDLAGNRPRFTATVLNDASGLHLHDVLARAATPAGEPLADGFTAGLQGTIAPGITGTVTGVIDRIDLHWLSDGLALVPLPPASHLDGETAMTWTATLADGQVRSVDGVALPLGVQLGFLDGAIAIDGITGAARFSIKPVGAAP